MASLDFEIYDGKTFRDLCKDINDRSQSKKDQLDTLFTDIRGHIKNINDAQVFVPRLKEIIEAGIKNDDQLVKLLAVVQRLQSTQLEASGGELGGISEDEKEQLLENMAKAKIKEIQKEVDSPILSSTSSIS